MTMSEDKNETTAKTDWSGKPAADAQPVKQTVAPPVPMEAAAAGEPAATAEHKEAAAPKIVPNSGYAVFFFPNALEALGAVVRPYLQTGNGEPHILCREVDTGGAFIELTVDGQSAEGVPQQVELMVPSNMVRLIMSVHADGVFGFARPSAKPLNY